MGSKDKAIRKYSELFGKIARIFYDEITICILDAIIKLYFDHFIFELEQLANMTSLEKDVVRKSLYSLRGNCLWN